jgi:hypothetical protein
MRPTDRELIDSVLHAIETQVAPHVTDKWAASTLRSAALLLRHVADRGERAALMLAEDIADARRTLTGVRALWPAAAAQDVLVAVDRVLALPSPPATDVAGLDALSEACQTVLDRLLRVCRDEPATDPDGALQQHLRDYLRRRLQREHTLYLPLFTGPPI